MRIKDFRALSKQKGFTLLEIILVLALISAIAVVIVPNLRVSIDSKMRMAIVNLTGQIRNAYDNAIFTGQLQRMVFNIKTGEYWTEQAPVGYEGRPPGIEDDNNSTLSSRAANLKNFATQLTQEEKIFSGRTSSSGSAINNSAYAIRSIPIVQKKVLLPVEWKEVNDAISYKQSLPAKIIIAQFSSNLTPEVLNYSATTTEKNKRKKYYGYIYFLPDGTTTGASLRLAAKKETDNDNNSISDKSEKYTLNLNTLTGQTHLLKGFQSANFSLLKK